jgi:solute carrier family 20 (sodium-dependent phosphate transporter)
MTDLSPFLWLVIVGFVFAFIYAFGIGANDVANAFATVVASGSLTLRQAVLVAAIFEFAGAFLLGAAVTNTVRSKIFDVKLYKDEPEVMLLGLFCALITGSIMLLGATAFAMPVSTTHTIIGSLMGFSIVAKGFDSINKSVAKKIFISWVISPACSALLAFVFFFLVKNLVLKSANPFQRAYYTFPIILVVTVFINVFYVIHKGLNNFDFVEKISLWHEIPASFGVGILVGIIWIVAWGPWAKARITAHFALMQNATQEVTQVKSLPDGGVEQVEQDGDEVMVDDYDVNEVKKETNWSSPPAATPAIMPAIMAQDDAPMGLFSRLAANTFDQDLRAQSMHESAKANELWTSGEQFDPEAEQLFTYVQVFTSCMDAFAHGANDVANAMGPISGMLIIYQEGEIESKAPVDKWILAFGGLGIVLGLLLYGYKVIKSIGYKLTMMSPSRGSMAELSTALFVVTASFLEIPVSTTQAQVGAVAGIGLVSGFGHVEWLFFLKVCISWVVVFFSAVVLSAGIFSMFAYTPTLVDLKEEL